MAMHVQLKTNGKQILIWRWEYRVSGRSTRLASGQLVWLSHFSMHRILNARPQFTVLSAQRSATSDSSAQTQLFLYFAAPSSPYHDSEASLDQTAERGLIFLAAKGLYVTLERCSRHCCHCSGHSIICRDTAFCLIEQAISLHYLLVRLYGPCLS